MKKVVSLVLSFAFLMSCLCLSGCNNQQNQNPNANDLVEALKNGGYEKTFYNTNCSAERSYHNTIEIPGIENDLYIQASTSDGNDPITRNIAIINYNYDVNREDTIKILNIIMPLFDDGLDNAGEEIIDNLEEISKDKNNAKELKIGDYAPSYYFSYEYHGFTFEKWTDENYNDEEISIFGLLESHLQKVGITAEEYFNQFN